MTDKQRAQWQRLQQAFCWLDLEHAQIRPAQMLMLATIADEPGLTQRELAERVGLTPEAVSRNMRSLGTQGRRRVGNGPGWIESTPDPNDDRINRVRLTAEGEKQLAIFTAMLWP